MLPEQTIEMIKNNKIDPRWEVFGYNKSRSFFIFLYKLFFAGLLLGMAGTLFFYSPHPLSPNLKITVYGLGSIGFIGLGVLLLHIYTMFFFRSNMIVLTETELIKSIRHKVLSWNYADITELRYRVSQIDKDTMPTYFIEFRNKKNNTTIQLSRGHEFKRAEELFGILNAKLQ